MRVGVANKQGVYQALPNLLSSLPRVQAEFFQPFGDYDFTVGITVSGVKEIVFNPEGETLAGKHYPVTIDYQDPQPLRLDRIVCYSDPLLLKRYSGILQVTGKVIVDEYKETRSILPEAISVEMNKEAAGVQLILHDGYRAKVDLLTAIARKQPFLVLESKASLEIVKALRCPYPWMLPFTGIQDAVTKLELLRMSVTLENSLEEARQRCFSERLHSRFIHLWAEVLLG